MSRLPLRCHQLRPLRRHRARQLRRSLGISSSLWLLARTPEEYWTRADRRALRVKGFSV
jgi:hypothetical protein